VTVYFGSAITARDASIVDPTHLRQPLRVRRKAAQTRGPRIIAAGSQLVITELRTAANWLRLMTFRSVAERAGVARYARCIATSRPNAHLHDRRQWPGWNSTMAESNPTRTSTSDQSLAEMIALERLQTAPATVSRSREWVPTPTTSEFDELRPASARSVTARRFERLSHPAGQERADDGGPARASLVEPGVLRAAGRRARGASNRRWKALRQAGRVWFRESWKEDFSAEDAEGNAEDASPCCAHSSCPSWPEKGTAQACNQSVANGFG